MNGSSLDDVLDCAEVTDFAGHLGSVEDEMARARTAQIAFGALPIELRLAIARRARHLIASRASNLAAAANPLSAAGALASEVLPLAEACRFLEREAASILAPRRLRSRGRPLWLSRVRAEVRREPFGVVLIIAASNYPLLLPGVQAIQALVAGNAVLLKPGSGGRSAALAFADILCEAGLDKRLLCVLAESAHAAQSAIEAQPDKVVLTGSAISGASVLSQLAEKLIPSTMELSGSDAVFVRADADLDLTVRALVFGLCLNNSATCIAPRRIFVAKSIAAELERRLSDLLTAIPRSDLDTATGLQLLPHIMDALVRGGRVIAGEVRPGASLSVPLLLANVSPAAPLLRTAYFAPVASIIPVANDEDALQFAEQCPYALGVTIFSKDTGAANAMAKRIPAGVVVINDMIVPTADPRLPFGGRKRSGFGTTRGREGLLEMTTGKAIAERRGNFRPHFDPTVPDDEKLFAAYITAAHGSGVRGRFSAFVELLKRLLEKHNGRV